MSVSTKLTIDLESEYEHSYAQLLSDIFDLCLDHNIVEFDIQATGDDEEECNELANALSDAFKNEPQITIMVARLNFSQR